MAGYGLREEHEKRFEPSWGTTVEEDEGDEWRRQVGFTQTVQVGHASARTTNSKVFQVEKPNYLETSSTYWSQPKDGPYGPLKVPKGTLECTATIDRVLKKRELLQQAKVCVVATCEESKLKPKLKPKL